MNTIKKIENHDWLDELINPEPPLASFLTEKYRHVPSDDIKKNKPNYSDDVINWMESRRRDDNDLTDHQFQYKEYYSRI